MVWVVTKGPYHDLQLLRLVYVALLGNALVQVLVCQAQDGQPVAQKMPALEVRFFGC